MPISHKHKCIFVHIPKTAGTSIEIALGIHGPNNNGDWKNPYPKILFGFESKTRFLQHLTSLEIKNRINKDIFERYLKFAFVRNPYERVVSEYEYVKMIKGLKNLSFKNFLIKNIVCQIDSVMLRKHYMSQYKYILDKKGNLMVDFIGRFENLEKDFRKICCKLKIKSKLPITNRTDRGDYMEYYTKLTKKIVQKRYKKDLELFGYEF